MAIALIVFLVVTALAVLWLVPRGTRGITPEPTSEGIAWQEGWDSIRSHFRGTFGVVALAIVLCAGGLILAIPSSIFYLWFVVPVLLAMTFVMVKVRTTVGNELSRGMIYVAVVIVGGTIILPRLPGDNTQTPLAPPHPFTQILNPLSLCTETLKMVTIGNQLQELNPGNSCFIRWAKPPPNICISVYDIHKKFIGEDCGRGYRVYPNATYFRTTNPGVRIDLDFVLCKNAGTIKDYVGACL